MEENLRAICIKLLNSSMLWLVILQINSIEWKLEKKFFFGKFNDLSIQCILSIKKKTKQNKKKTQQNTEN